MPFVKLDCGMLDSTLWIDRDSREIFITALLMAEFREIFQPLEQIEVRTLERTGFQVPPGWYGFVSAAGVGIAHRARLEEEQGLAALEKLGAPDPGSRSSEFEGRRLIRVDGGYIVLNYLKYRERDYGSAERMRRYRIRKAQQTVTRNSNGVTAFVARNETHAEAEAYTEQETPFEAKGVQGEARAARSARATRLPEDFELTPERRAIAEAEKADPDREFANFVDHWRAASGAKARKCDWEATWRVWCRRACEFKPQTRYQNPDDTGWRPE